MIPEDIQITNNILLQGALVFALMDVVFVPILVWRIKLEQFQKIKWISFIVAGIIWFGIWQWAIGNFWESVYIHVFPAWGRPWIPAAFGLFNATIGLCLWALALRTRLNPTLSYCFLGGLWGILTHIWAVYRGVVEKPPMLQGASPVAAVIIAFFEYMFYWCVILSLSALLHWGWTSLRSKAK